MMTLTIINLVSIIIIFLIGSYFYKKTVKKSNNLLHQIDEININRNKAQDFITNKIDELIKSFEDSKEDVKKTTKAQKEVNKLFTQWQSNIDITLINLIDVPYIDNELDPGYPKEWEGEVPYPINEVFEGSEIKVKYLYNIDKVSKNRVKLSRKQ